MKDGPASDRDRLALGIDHLKRAVKYTRRGRVGFFDEGDELLAVGVESELRKAFETLHRRSPEFLGLNPGIGKHDIFETRQLLTHDDTQVDRETVWRIAKEKTPTRLPKLERAKLP